MQAIQTKVLPATNYRPSRIRVWCARGRYVAPIPQNMGAAESETHNFFARKLCAVFADSDFKEYGTPKEGNPWSRPLVSGCLPDGTFAHVFKS